MADLAIIIVSFNTKQLTLGCLESIYSFPTASKFEVFLVDNGSLDNTVSEVKKKYPQVKIIKSDKNLGFGKANNLAFKKTRAANYLLLNSDTKITYGSIDKLLEFANKENWAIFSCKLVDFDGHFQPNAGYLPTPLPMLIWLSGFDDLAKVFGVGTPSHHLANEKNYYNRMPVGWVSGSAMFIKDEVLKKGVKFDDNIFMYGEDIDICWQASRLGFKVGWMDQTEIFHLGGGSSKDAKFNQWLGEFKGLIYLYKKYYGLLPSVLVRLLIYFFIILRIVAFTILGKFNFSKTYAKIIVSI